MSLRCVEYRIPVPLTLDEYQIGIDYAYFSGIKEQMGTGAGVTLLERREFEEDDPKDIRMEAGTYRRKENQFGHHLPAILRGLAPEGSLAVIEESWDCFPYKKSVFKSAYMGESFYLEVRQMIVEDDRGDLENPLMLEEEYLGREIEYIDILLDDKTSSPLEGGADVVTFQSEKHERGPIKENFHESHEPITTVYSAVIFRLVTPMLQETAENLLLSWGVRDMLLAVHRRAYCTIDAWKDIHDEETLLELEDEVLNSKTE
jgi:hypothetical protein